MSLEKRIEALEKENAELKRQLEERQNMEKQREISICSLDIEKFIIAARVILEKIQTEKRNLILIDYNPNERTIVKINNSRDTAK